MSAWVVALGLGAGYLINKNTVIQDKLAESVERFNSAAKPATGSVTSKEVRDAYKRTDFVKYGDMNSDLPKGQMDCLLEKERRRESAVEAFDAGPTGPSKIEGVLLTYDRLGV